LDAAALQMFRLLAHFEKLNRQDVKKNKRIKSVDQFLICPDIFAALKAYLTKGSFVP
jgi:hypothetical protein